jgi:PAS domain S-box-containing protein
VTNILPEGALLSEAQFSVAMEHSPIGTAIASLHGKWLWANAELRQLLGYSQAELSQLTFQDVTHADDLEADTRLVEQLVAGELRSYAMEKRYIRKNGNAISVLLTVALVREAACGKPLYFIKQVQDITAKLAAESERVQLLERVSLATRIAEVGIWDWEFKTNAIRWDEVMFGLYGAPPEGGVTLKTFEGYVHPEDRARVGEELSAAVAGDRFDTHFRINRHDDEVRTIRALGTMMRDADGAPARMIGTNWDVTDRLRLQDEATAASRAKSQFLATMSHEIRTPLNGILGIAQVMAMAELSELQRQRLQVIRESGESLLCILNEILDLSKVEAGKLELEQIEFNLEGLLKSACAPYFPIALDKGVSLRVEAEEVGCSYRGDPTRIRQVVTNLISNAVKFTSTGMITVIANSTPTGVDISVSDTGIGIPPTALAQIFAPFEQADASMTRRYGGTGLGLAIVRKLVGLMTSELGEGSSFRIRLPLQQVASGVAESQTLNADEVKIERSIRLLAAEDNGTNRLVLRTLLNQLGIEPTIAVNGREALDAWRSGSWDVILMDLQMPVMDGLAATRAIRAEEAALNRDRTPILALTANAMPHQIAECLASGIDALVAKPIDVRALMTAIQVALQPPQHSAERRQEA